MDADTEFWGQFNIEPSDIRFIPEEILVGDGVTDEFRLVWVDPDSYRTMKEIWGDRST